MLFDTSISEQFPSLGMDLTLYTEQFKDENNMKKVQNLIETGLSILSKTITALQL